MESVFRKPSHVYTQVLLSSIPIPDPSVHRERLPMLGEPPSPTEVTTGCPFRPRCPQATEECKQPQPYYEVEPGHRAACRLAKPEGGRESLARVTTGVA